jgi:hypothetical protein
MFFERKNSEERSHLRAVGAAALGVHIGTRVDQNREKILHPRARASSVAWASQREV